MWAYIFACNFSICMFFENKLDIKECTSLPVPCSNMHETKEVGCPYPKTVYTFRSIRSISPVSLFFASYGRKLSVMTFMYVMSSFLPYVNKAGSLLIVVTERASRSLPAASWHVPSATLKTFSLHCKISVGSFLYIVRSYIFFVWSTYTACFGSYISVKIAKCKSKCWTH